METTKYARIDEDARGVDLVMEYAQDVEKMREVLKTMTVKIRYLGIKKYFPDDKEYRQVIGVSMKRDGQKIAFPFGLSVNDTEKIMAGTFEEWETLYNVLSCCGSDFFIPETFKDFCYEFGYDEDSRREAQRTFRACRIQSAKLHKIFTDEEIQAFPS